MSHLSKGRRIAALLATAGLAAAGLVVTMTDAASASTSLVTVTKVSPALGSTTGTVNVTITGKAFTTHFTEADANVHVYVTGGTTPATGVTVSQVMVISDTQMVAKIAGSGTAVGGSYDLAVDDSQGTPVAATLVKGFTLIAPINVDTTTHALGATVLNPLGGGSLIVPIDTASSIGTDATTFKNLKVTATIGGVAAPITAEDFTAARQTVTVKVPAGTPSDTKVPVMVLSNAVKGATDSTHVSYGAVISKLSVTSAPTSAGLTGTSAKPALTITGKGFGDPKASPSTAGGTFQISNPGGPTSITCVVVNDTKATCDSIPAATGTAGPGVVSFTPAAALSETYAATPGATFTYTDVI